MAAKNIKIDLIGCYRATLSIAKTAEDKYYLTYTKDNIQDRPISLNREAVLDYIDIIYDKPSILLYSSAEFTGYIPAFRRIHIIDHVLIYLQSTERQTVKDTLNKILDTLTTSNVEDYLRRSPRRK
jgi:hypothetical protein